MIVCLSSHETHWYVEWSAIWPAHYHEWDCERGIIDIHTFPQPNLPHRKRIKSHQSLGFCDLATQTVSTTQQNFSGWYRRISNINVTDKLPLSQSYNPLYGWNHWIGQ